MIVMARDRDYGALLDAVRGRRVLIWTCNTCARLCGVGGSDAAERLASKLSADGVDVVGSASSSACCFMSKADRMAGSAPDGYDLVLCLTCDMGGRNASEATGREVLNPVVTFGPGYIDRQGRNRVASVVCGRTVMDEASEDVAERNGCPLGPFA